MDAGQVINIEGFICPPEVDVVFNEWYDEEYIPNNMKFKGLIEVTRYRLVRFTDYATVKDYPQYFTTYKFRDLATFEVWNASPELTAASEDIRELFARLGVDFSRSIMTSITVCAMASAWICAVRFSQDGGRPPPLPLPAVRYRVRCSSIASTSGRTQDAISLRSAERWLASCDCPARATVIRNRFRPSNQLQIFVNVSTRLPFRVNFSAFIPQI